MTSVIVERHIRFREKLKEILTKLSQESGFPVGRLEEIYRENYCLLYEEVKNKTHLYEQLNCLALSYVIKTCEAKDSVHLYQGENVESRSIIQAWNLFSDAGLTDEEIWGFDPNIIVPDDDFIHLYKDRLYVPFKPTLERDAFEVNVMFFSKELGRNTLRYRMLPISIPKGACEKHSDALYYFDAFPCANEADFWLYLYVLEKHRNLFEEDDDSADDILSRYGFSSFPLEDSKRFLQ